MTNCTCENLVILFVWLLLALFTCYKYKWFRPQSDEIWWVSCLAIGALSPLVIVCMAVYRTLIMKWVDEEGEII